MKRSRKAAPVDDEAAFQHAAAMADVGVAAIMARVQGEGGDPRAVASGALFAVVRYHLDFLNVPRTPRAVLAVMIPATAKCVRNLLGLPEPN